MFVLGRCTRPAFTLAAFVNEKMASTIASTSATEYHLCLVGRVGAAQSPKPLWQEIVSYDGHNRSVVVWVAALVCIRTVAILARHPRQPFISPPAHNLDYDVVGFSSLLTA